MRLADLPVVVDTNEGGEALLVDSFTSLANFTFSFQDFFTLRRFDPKRDVLFALELPNPSLDPTLMVTYG